MKDKSSRERHLFAMLYTLIVLLTAIIGLRYISIYFGSNNNKSNLVTYDKYYVMISDNNQSEFWKSVYESAYNYGLTKNVFVEDLAATFSNELTKEELMRIAIASNVDGILLSADDSEEISNLIDEATEKNIPVVTLYNDASSSSRISYVGVDNFSIDKEYGRQSINIARDIYNERPNEEINVIVLVDAVPSSVQMMVYSTLQDTFENDALSSLLQLDTVKIDRTNTFSVEETIRDLFITGDVPDIIICLSELDTTCVYQAVIDYNKVGLVSILGYFDSDAILQGIDRNIIYSTIKIDTRQMGEYCIDALVEYDAIGFTSQYFAADFDVINTYNVGTYLEDNDEN